MTSSRFILFSQLVLGCVIAQPLFMPQHAKKRIKRGIESLEASQNAGDGSPEGIRQNPDKAKSYENWDGFHFAGMQNTMDGYFMNYEDKSRKEHKATHQIIEKSHYGTMSDTFKLTNEDMVSATNDLSKATERSEEFQEEDSEEEEPPPAESAEEDTVINNKTR